MSKRKIKLLGILTVLLAVVLVVSACGSSSSSGGSTSTSGNTSSSSNGGNGSDDGKTYTIKIGHVLTEDYHYTDGAKKFKELVEERSNGRITVEIYPNAQLGDEREMLEGLQMGTIEMGIISSGPVAGYVPQMALLDLGYLFESNEIAQKVLNGPVGDELNEKMIEVGFRNLAFLDMPYRSIYASKPIKSVEDLKGLKIRTLETPAQLELFKALGAAPTPMGYSEVYTALQQGVIDAAENVPDALYSSKHYEVAKHYSLTNHFYLIMMYLISEDFYQSLPEDLQQIVSEAAVEAAEYENGLIREILVDVYNKLEAEGVTIHEIDDLSPFIERAKESWKVIASQVEGGEELLQKVLEETGQTLD